ncbi:MAG: transglutaminase domain-containing protein, partial [Nitrososphaera sp.]
PYQLYYQYRSNSAGHAGAYIESSETAQYFQTSLGTWRDIKFLADILRKQANYDDEVFVNMVLQLTHQFYYQPSTNTKYPVETFVEGSGDCDTLAVFAAALMKAGGLDTVVISGYAKGSPEDELGIGHAMVGVALSEQPDDHYREFSSYVDYDGERYYLGEATWNNQLLTQQFDYTRIGTAVGDNPWSEFSITSTVGTPQA